MRTYGELATPSYTHTLDSILEPCDDLPLAQDERDWFAVLARATKLFSATEKAAIVYCDSLATLGNGPVTARNLLYY
jgi:hypothetical protein